MVYRTVSFRQLQAFTTSLHICTDVFFIIKIILWMSYSFTVFIFHNNTIIFWTYSGRVIRFIFYTIPGSDLDTAVPWRQVHLWRWEQQCESGFLTPNPIQNWKKSTFGTLQTGNKSNRVHWAGGRGLKFCNNLEIGRKRNSFRRRGNGDGGGTTRWPGRK